MTKQRSFLKFAVLAAFISTSAFASSAQAETVVSQSGQASLLLKTASSTGVIAPQGPLTSARSKKCRQRLLQCDSRCSAYSDTSLKIVCKMNCTTDYDACFR